jgi:hypothetical protein
VTESPAASGAAAHEDEPAEATTAKPTAGEATAAKPTAGEAKTAEPTTAKPAAAEPAIPEAAPAEAGSASSSAGSGSAVTTASAKTAAAAGAAGSAQNGSSQVMLVPGIARYHRRDCILIRFLSQEDLEIMPRRTAEARGCVPCKACKPDRAPAQPAVS